MKDALDFGRYVEPLIGHLGEMGRADHDGDVAAIARLPTRRRILLDEQRQMVCWPYFARVPVQDGADAPSYFGHEAFGIGHRIGEEFSAWSLVLEFERERWRARGS
jgi:hypothetical protein